VWAALVFFGVGGGGIAAVVNYRYGYLGNFHVVLGT